jgi:peptidoglycan/LPS O-acetylase OafA/YrhL
VTLQCGLAMSVGRASRILQRHGRLALNRSTSLYLDIVRPAAALLVLLSHVSFQGLSEGQLSFLSEAGTQAVDVFFVLSGFVIAHAVATREQDVRTYVVSRAARIFSVALPALFLTAAADAIGTRLNPGTYDGPFQSLSPTLVMRCVLFLGEQWNVHRFPGSNGPYWSLGFEVWYYIAFGAFAFSAPRWRWIAIVAVLIFIGPKVSFMFPAWLIGVAIYHARVVRRLTPSAGWLLVILPILMVAGYQFVPHSSSLAFMPFTLELNRLWGIGQDYFVAAAFSAHLMGVVVVSKSFAPWLERHARSIRWIAGGTFSLYLAHLPIMHLLAAASPWPKSSVWTLILLLAVTPVACLAFAEIFERRKDAWRKLIVGFLQMLEITFRTWRRKADPTL